MFVHGKNFLFKWATEEQGKKIEKAGFYVTVFVEAEDFQSAENAAVELLREDRTLLECKNPKTDPPMLHVQKFQEVESFEQAGNHHSGFVFYTGDGHE